MVRRLTEGIYRDYPEYMELYSLLSLAATTWRLFGISAGELAEMDDLTREMIKLISQTS